ncbi:hypothetical protein HTZ77_17495 [Nonomuraea sp. SMC257]|uniref:Uncharacterized protein n=1 Tax=Nonomuraea montanisoli TaxID=2741721 RepID=A0A7Y6M3G9_9ACTN|nr:hypothetical protein [Nonomuraea montanisoli]NUW33212.1 hypothetical protein [Nonomuraea montanisoli]
MTGLERLVGSVRARADERLYATVARQVERADAGLPQAWSGLLVVPEGARISELERLRQAPKRQSGTEMAKASDGDRTGGRAGQPPIFPKDVGMSEDRHPAFDDDVDDLDEEEAGSSSSKSARAAPAAVGALRHAGDGGGRPDTDRITRMVTLPEAILARTQTT